MNVYMKKHIKSQKKYNKKIILGTMIVVGITIIAIVVAIIGINLYSSHSTTLSSSSFSFLEKKPVLQDGKYCEVTGQFSNIAKSIVYNDYFCVEVTNKKTYTVVIVTETPAALRMEKSYEATFQFDVGEPIEIKNDDDEIIATIEQLDDKTLLFRSVDDSTKREVSIDVEEDFENQADK